MQARLLVDHRLADFVFQELDISNRRSARAGDEDAVGVAPFGVEPLGDLIRRVHRQVGELGVLAHTVAGDLQDRSRTVLGGV